MRETDQSVQITTGSLGDFEEFEGLEELSPKRTLFVCEYLKDGNGTQAAIRAGYSEHTADEQASRLLANVKVRSAIADRMRAAAKAAGVDAALVVSELYDIATADPTEHAQTVLDCCRYCHGISHLYQWTPGQYRQALDEALGLGKPAPEMQGGLSFDPRREPAEDCPECAGRGIVTVIHTPSKKVSKAARKLLASVKQNKDGSVELKMRDQDKALELLGRVCGVFRDRQELSGPGGAPLQVAPAPPLNSLTNEQLEDILRKRGMPLPPRTIEGELP
jgi:phage terminase small subunit